MATRKTAVPAAPAAVVVAAPAVTVPAVIERPIERPKMHLGRTWEAQASRENVLQMGNPSAPLFLRGPNGWLVRCAGDRKWYRRLAIAWRLTGGRMEHARVGCDCLTYARFVR